jgi:hypothetical protein
MVTSFVSLAARSCETFLAESTETLERLVGSLGQLWPGAAGGRAAADEPWWATPEGGDERFVDLADWEPGPAGPWSAC